MTIALNILKRFWREALIVILVLVVVGSVRKCSENKSDAELLSHVGDSAFSVANYYQNKNGDLIGQVKTHEGTIDQLKKYGDQLGFDNGKLKKQVGKLSRLVSHLQGQAGMSGEIDHIDLIDSTISAASLDPTFDLGGGEINLEVPGISVKTFEWSNDYLWMSGVINLDSNSMSLKYEYDTDFTVTAYYRPMGLFKKPQLVTDIWFEDQSMKVQDIKGYVVIQPKRRFYQTGIFKFSLGLGAGAGLAYVILK